MIKNKLASLIFAFLAPMLLASQASAQKAVKDLEKVEIQFSHDNPKYPDLVDGDVATGIE